MFVVYECLWASSRLICISQGCNTGQVYRTASFIHFPYAANQLQEGKSSLTAESLISMSKNEVRVACMQSVEMGRYIHVHD